MFHRILLSGLLFLPILVKGHGDVTEATHAALQSAMEGGGLIRILTTNTITLTNTITISQDTTIEGVPGATISGGGITRIYTIGNGVKFRGSNIKFERGFHQGISTGATGEFSWYSPTHGSPGMGGAIYSSSAEVHLTDCQFVGNTAVGGRGGPGSRYPGGRMGSGSGGALAFGSCSVFITNCTFANNTAKTGNFDGIGGQVASTVALPASGGAIAQTGGSLLIQKALFISNFAQGGDLQWIGSQAGGRAAGGGIFFEGVHVQLSQTTFAENHVISFLNHAEGGALWIKGNGQIEQSSFADNHIEIGTLGMLRNDGGAIYTEGNLAITNSTIWRNSANQGGGIFAGGGELILTHCTLELNRLTGTNTTGLALDGTNGAVIRSRASIIAASALLDEGAYPIVDLGHNIFSDNLKPFAQTINIQPGLQSPSQRTGGGVSILPHISSPAVDAVPLNEAPSVDQLGFPRLGGKADIGAREVGPNVLHWQHSSGPLGAWVGDSDIIDFYNSIWPLGPNTTVGSTWRVIKAADANGDGVKDLLWQHENGLLAVWPIANLGLSIQGSPYFLNTPKAPAGWAIAGWGNYDNDSDLDLLWQRDDGALAVWWMDGNNLDKSVLLSHLPKPGADWKVVSVRDFNGDSIADLLWQSKSSGLLALWTLNSQLQLLGEPGLFLNTSDPVVQRTGPDWKIVAVTDYDMDQIDDLIWQNSKTGMVAYWGMNSERQPVPSKMKLISNVAPGAQWRVINVVTP